MDVHEELTKAVAKATSDILAILPKAAEGSSGRLIDQEVESKVGGIVCRIVAEAGGGATVLFEVTESLTRKIPLGARNLRSMYYAFRQNKILDEAAVGLYELMVGDPDADAIEIGGRVYRAMAQCWEAAVEPDALAKLAAKLEVSPWKLANYRDIYLVAQFWGAELSELTTKFPSSILIHFARILKADAMPWAKKKMLLKAAGEAIGKGLEGRQISALVAHIVAEAGKAEPQPAVVPPWNLLRTLARATGAQDVATGENAA